MASTTPTAQALNETRSRSASRTRIPSRPTTPLRPSSRSSLRNSQTASASLYTNPLDALEPQFAEFSDGMADLEANLMHLQLMHESLGRFSESFASFLYGLNMNAFCVDFVEGPVAESFARPQNRIHTGFGDSIGRVDGGAGGGISGGGLGASTGPGDLDATFLTTDTSFVENPPASSKASSKFSTPAPSRTRGANTRGTTTRGRGGIPRASGIARGSGIARATSSRGRGRGTGTH